MKSLKRRIAFHFSLQFIALLIFIFFFILVLLFFFSLYLIELDVKINPLAGITEAISTEVNIEDGEVQMNEQWKETLDQNEMWIQILDSDGEVIYSYNTPNELITKYRATDLLAIEETSHLNHYKVHSSFVHSEKNEYHYFLVGYDDHISRKLKEWFDSYQDYGLVKTEQLTQLQEELKSLNGSLHIYQDGELVQTIGDDEQLVLTPLELVGRVKEPGNFATEMTVYRDPTFNTTWVLHRPNEELSQTDFFLFKKEALIMILICFIALFVAILLSWWHGYRYGKPLLLFMDWLDRLGKGQYKELLTEKEQKKIFRKNGKIRIRYRLYNEVFQSFYTMTKKLTAAQEERKRLEKTREEWMTGISHDLRTPLSTIQGYAHMLESNQYEFSKDELAEIGKVMREKGDYMLNLVNDFTLVFKLKNSTISLETVATEVNGFVQQIVDKFAKDLTMKQAKFSFSGTKDALYLPLDPNWFERVLDNLINNAVKHNNANTNIQVSVELEQNNVMISINDDGIGMDEVTVANLFERYYRGTSTNEKTEGAGLGMSIAKAIVKLHGGSITVHSQEGEGTSIRLRFPLEK